MLRQTVPNTSSGDGKGSVADGRQRRTADNQRRRRGRTQTMSTPEARRPAKPAGKARRCCSAPTPVDKESEPEVNSLPCPQPAQPAEEWADTCTCTCPFDGLPVFVETILELVHRFHSFTHTVTKKNFWTSILARCFDFDSFIKRLSSTRYMIKL